MKFIGKKGLLAGVLGLGLVLTGVGVANAGTTLLGYNYVLPKFQLPGGGNYDQTKAISSFPGWLQGMTIGGSYNVAARECRDIIFDCGAQVNNVYTYGHVDLPNSIPAGTVEVNAQQRINTFNFVDVQVTGYFASN